MQNPSLAGSRLGGEAIPIRKSFNGAYEQQIHGIAKRAARRSAGLQQRKQMSLVAQAKGQADPPDVPKARNQPQGGREWLQSILSRFGPIKEKASNTTVLDFEKPLVELDNRIKEVGTGPLFFFSFAIRNAPHCGGAGQHGRAS
jgi:hypothetical protein